jgi:DNA-binding transcriptional MerR regulator
MHFSVRQVAHLFGNTTEGIRFYESMGLIRPDRDISNNRIYSLSDIAELFHLKRYSSLGVTLKEIIEFFSFMSPKNIAQIATLLKKKEDNMQQKIRFYEKLIQWIKNYRGKLDNINDCLSGFTEGSIKDTLIFREDGLENNFNQQVCMYQKWFAVAPLSVLSRITVITEGRVQETYRGWCIERNLGEELNLPTPSQVMILRGSSYLYRIIKLECSTYTHISMDVLLSLEKEARDAGYRVSGLVLSSFLFAQRVDNVLVEYYEVFLILHSPDPLITPVGTLFPDSKSDKK